MAVESSSQIRSAILVRMAMRDASYLAIRPASFPEMNWVKPFVRSNLNPSNLNSVSQYSLARSSQYFVAVLSWFTSLKTLNGCRATVLSQGLEGSGAAPGAPVALELYIRENGASNAA